MGWRDWSGGPGSSPPEDPNVGRADDIKRLVKESRQNILQVENLLAEPEWGIELDPRGTPAYKELQRHLSEVQRRLTKETTRANVAEGVAAVTKRNSMLFETTLSALREAGAFSEGTMQLALQLAYMQKRVPNASDRTETANKELLRQEVRKDLSHNTHYQPEPLRPSWRGRDMGSGGINGYYESD